MRFDGRPPDIRTLRAHAAEISTVRLRLAWIGSVCRSLTWDDESFGSLAGWIAAALDRVTARQAELVEYVAENFAIFADDLWESVAAGDEDPQRPVEFQRPVGPVVIRSPWLLDRPADQYTYLHERITDGEWIDPALVVGHSRAGPDPFDPATAHPATWALPQLEPLRGVLDGLTGRPAVVAAQVATLHGTAADLHGVRTDLQRALRPVLGWPGGDVDQYLGLMTHNLDALAGLIGTAIAIALCAEAAESLVGSVRGHLQERVAALVAEASRLADDGGPPEPALAAAVAECHRHALGQVAALVSSLTELAELVES